MKKKQKKRIVFGSIAVLSLAAAVLCTAAVVHASKASLKTAEKNETSEVQSDIQSDIGNIIIEADSDSSSNIHLEEDLKPYIDFIIDDIQDRCGGEWSVYIEVPSTNDTLSINQKKMQAASLIKLYIMGAVYDEYESLENYYKDEDIPWLMEAMITVSDNESADQLVFMLGRGDANEGKKKVNDFCHSIGLNNTVMGRLIEQNDIVNDNFTTTEDAGKFLSMILNGDLKHSKDMLKYLQAQTRVNKIPAGVPTSVATANKTGELDDVQNDAAIVFAGKPYIICVMADGVEDYQPPIDSIVDISEETYIYLAPKLVERE